MIKYHSKINELLKNQYVQDLLEEGFIQASRAITDERKLYISNLVSTGIKGEDEEILKSKYILSILKELNDSEIILLNYTYYNYNQAKKDELKSKNEEILGRKFLSINSSEKERIDLAIQSSYLDHLWRLQLVEHKVEINKISKDVILDNGGKPKIKSSEVTSLGGYLLKLIGLTDSIYPIDEVFKIKNNKKNAQTILVQDILQLLETTNEQKIKNLRDSIILNSKILYANNNFYLNSESILKMVDGFIARDGYHTKSFVEHHVSKISKLEF